MSAAAPHRDAAPQNPAEDLLALLDTSVPDAQVAHLLQRADALTRELAGNRGYVWAAIGIDSTPCAMGCSFCSHAACWGAYNEQPPLPTDTVVALAGQAADAGADFVTLRTTQHYGIERLCALARRVRARIGDAIQLVVNTGEADIDAVAALRAAGVSMSYHTVRLREGVDTGHSLDQRLRSLAAIRAAGMGLQYLVEPVGPEHTAAEIITEARRARQLGAHGTGVMARIPVMGTPLAHLGQVSEAGLHRLTAVARLAYPDGGAICCTHPPSPGALTCGCNTVVVEQAANPRDTGSSEGAWRGFDLGNARAMLRQAGFSVRTSAG
ncbi:MAG: hypothetical protein ACOCZK_02375 [Planctomycetota bacterium]